MLSLDNYALIILDENSKPKIYLLDNNYHIIAEKKLDFGIKLSAFGSDNIILINDNDKIININKNLDFDNFKIDFLNNENIINIKFNPNDKVFNIITTKRLLVMDNQLKKIISSKNLSEPLYNFDFNWFY